ncbi:MAG TPA: class I SAM-dependent methyltransferase [Acidimicrobiales bacterium]|nr:class I SAM-dependent methyltransferase [Acidimicrobiales bacterium]
MSNGARRQGELWGQAANDWANLQEGTVLPAVRRALELVEFRRGDRVLDVGCGAGGAMLEASKSGAVIDGIDVAPALIEIARQRVPSASFHVADMMALPYPDEIFDVVTGFNSFPYALDPVGALRQARRVGKSGARFALVVWGREEECEAVVHFRALRALLPPAPAGSPAPLAADQRMPHFMQAAGLTIRHDESVSCPWDYPDVTVALRALRSAGPVRRVLEILGDEVVDTALRDSLTPFTNDDGEVRIENRFRVLIAAKE